MQFRKPQILGQSGFSLIELTITMGLLGLASMLVMNLTDNVNVSTKRAELVLSKSEFVSSLGQYLYGDLGCSEIAATTFLKSPPAGTILTTLNTTPVNLTKWRILSHGSPILNVKAGTKLTHFEITKFWATINYDPTLPQTILSPFGNVSKTSLFVQLTLQSRGKLVREYDYFFNIPVIASFNPISGTVRKCGEQKSIAEACENIGGLYNPVTKICDQDKTCKVMGTYELLTCQHENNYPSGPLYGSCSNTWGSSKNNPLTNAPSCPAGSGSTPTQTSIQTWAHQISCGKKGTCDIYNRKVWMTCLKCT